MWPDQCGAGEILHIYKRPSSSDIQPRMYCQASCLKAFCGKSKNQSRYYLDLSSPVHGAFTISRKLTYPCLQKPKSEYTLWTSHIVLLFTGGLTDNKERTSAHIINILLKWNILSLFPNISHKDTIRSLYHLFQCCFFILTNHLPL